MKDDLKYTLIITIYTIITVSFCSILYKENFIYLSGVFSGITFIGLLYIIWLHFIEKD